MKKKEVKYLLASSEHLRNEIMSLMIWRPKIMRKTKLSKRIKKRVIKWMKKCENVNYNWNQACDKGDIDLETSGYLEDENAEIAYESEVNKHLDTMEMSLS